MRKPWSILMFFRTFNFLFAQTLPIDFENGIVTTNFLDFDGGTSSVLVNPQPSGINLSTKVTKIKKWWGYLVWQ